MIMTWVFFESLQRIHVKELTNLGDEIVRIRINHEKG